ncbi:MAG TPA: PQQ-dependent sugar dehydrogenase [Sphingomicrobium sp.]|nr:PQQ-dependent sugar dehydrogenase [Sphingomicrobium sp.]
MIRSAALPGLALLAAAWSAAPAIAQGEESQNPPPLPATSTVNSQSGPIRVDVIARGLVHPWGLALLPDGRALVTERNDGRPRIVGRDGRLSAPVAGMPPVFRFVGITPRSQSGLFDIKLHPNFARNRQIYLSFSAPTERGASVRVVRARLAEAGGSSRLENLQTVFEMQEDDQDSSGLHFGGRMAIAPRDNALFLSIGDRRNISRSQDKEDQAGSILRMTLDGQAHSANPSRRDAGTNNFIFASGSRNSQALALDAEGRLWSIEHGPQGGDRVDLVRPGVNLGWPFISAGPDYSDAPIGVGTSRQGMQSHVFEETVAPSGAIFYRGAMFPAWSGNLLVGGLAIESLMRLTIQGERVAGVEKIDIGRRIRDVELAADGSIWLITEHEDGELLRLTRVR